MAREQRPTALMAGLGAPYAELRSVAHETKLERRLDRLIARAENPRKAAAVIATVTTSITVVAGVLMRFVDHDNFPTIGGGLWWAVQTVTTVGYGDHVPTSATGQLLATVVMLFGIGFLTVITASITGAFVARSSRERDDAAADSSQSDEDVRSINARLDRIEAILRERV
jgi:voltage-gated potassium channel